MSYKKFDEADLAFLKSLCGDERVTERGAVGEDYCHDELGGAFGRPDARVRVLSTAEISAVMKHASARRIPVTVRGSGTGLVGGAVPVRGGILLDTSGMTRILELDEANMTLTVEPGVLLTDLAKYAEERGFLYPPDPGEKTATIGGNISTNAGGMRAVKYGVTRDYVRALEVVLADGTVATLGGKVAKNSSGYDLKDLVVGSEGTLAVVTRATLRLVALPKCRISLLVPFPDLPSAIRAVPSIIRAASSRSKSCPGVVFIEVSSPMYQASTVLSTRPVAMNHKSFSRPAPLPSVHCIAPCFAEAANSSGEKRSP